MGGDRSSSPPPNPDYRSTSGRAAKEAARRSRRKRERKLRRYRKVFDKIDAAHVNSISSDQLFLALRLMAATTTTDLAHNNWTSLYKELRKQLFNEGNGYSRISFDRFVEIMENLIRDPRSEYRRFLVYFVGNEAHGQHGFLSSGWKVLPNSFALGQPDLGHFRLYLRNLLMCCRPPIMTLGRFWPNRNTSHLHYLISCQATTGGLVFHFANADWEVFERFSGLYQGDLDKTEAFIGTEVMRQYLRNRGVNWSAEQINDLVAQFDSAQCGESNITKITRTIFCRITDLAFRRVRAIRIRHKDIRAQDIRIDTQREARHLEPSATILLEFSGCEVIRWGDEFSREGMSDDEPTPPLPRRTPSFPIRTDADDDVLRTAESRTVSFTMNQSQNSKLVQ